MGVDGGSKVFADDGRPLTLDRELRSGGAGSIHRIIGVPDLVAKIYHPQVDRSIYERKVAAMLTFIPDLPDIVEGGLREVQIAWPRTLLRDGQRRFVGFTMPLLDFAASIELECVLQERQARAQGLPTGLGAKVTLAANLASLIAELHRQGHYVVDLKPVNLRFYRRSLHVAMLDCDGYSIKGDGRRFSAPQFTPEYLAPEFQSEGLSAGGDLASNEEKQDRFALSVIIFQLLNFGIHPFTGRPASERIPSDIPGRIAHGCYAYGLRANPEMAPNPASGHTAMPTELRQLFDRAFAVKGGRPSADEWVSRLHTYGRRSTGMLVACRADGSHQHFAGLPCSACARKAVLTKASTVVRPPPRKAPKWAPKWAPKRPVYQPAPAVPTILTPPPSKPSFMPSDWLTAIPCIVPALLFMLILGAEMCTHRPTRTRHEYAAMATPEEPPPPRLPTVTNLDEVLRAVKSSDKDALDRKLRGLPSMGAPNQNECQSAIASWEGKVEWTRDDPAFAKDGYLSSPFKWRGTACTTLHYLVPRIVRTQALCKTRLHSPGAYPGIGEAQCRNNDLLQAGVDTLRRALVYGRAREPYIWYGMADAFLLNDENENAEAAFVVSAFHNRRLGLDEGRGSLAIIDDQWLHGREEILMARAAATIRLWNDEPISEELYAKLRAPWPAEPPPTKPTEQ